jgi:hypothetical protein
MYVIPTFCVIDIEGRKPWWEDSLEVEFETLSVEEMDYIEEARTECIVAPGSGMCA